MVYVTIGVIFVAIIWIIVSYNTLIQANIKVDEAIATMDIFLKKRYDLIPNLVESCKGYMKHESKTLKEIAELRNKAISCDDKQQQMKTEAELSSGIRKIFALAENYPDLKSSVNFVNLNTQMAKIEEDIAQARKYYNAVVRIYNTKISLFPTNMIAGILGFSAREMFEISSVERENIRVSFDD